MGRVAVWKMTADLTLRRVRVEQIIRARRFSRQAGYPEATRDLRDDQSDSAKIAQPLCIPYATLTVSVPRPLTSPTMVSPDTTAATPSGVPV